MFIKYSTLATLFTVVLKNVILCSSFTLDKQHIKTDFGIILAGTSFQAFDIHCTIIDSDANALFIFPLGVSK
jgi:hypothetical protein